MTSVALALKETIDLFDGLFLSYVIGGSFASSAWGQYRFTQDLDLAIDLASWDVDDLVERAEPRFLVDKVEIEGTLLANDEYRSFQMLHLETMFKIDCFVPLRKGDFEMEVKRSQRVELIPGVFAPCLSAEDVILRKLRWFELGNRVSDRQWNDILQVLEMQAGRLDDAYLAENASRFGVRDLLDEARLEVRS